MYKRYIITVIVATLLVVSAVPGDLVASTSEIDGLTRQYYLSSDNNRPMVLDEIRLLGTGEALQFTLDLLKYPDIKVRQEAIGVLKNWGKSGFEAIFAGLDDPEINWMCESIFVELGSRAVPFLIEMLEHKDPLRRGQAAFLLGSIRDVIAVGPLYDHLRDPSRDVRIQVIQALCDLGDEQSLTRILDLFELEDVGLADFVLHAAERFGPRAAGSLRVALRSSNVRVRCGAALAMGRIKVPDTLPFMFDALDDPSPAVRRSIVRALDMFESMEAAEGLFMAMSDEDLEVQEYATTALAKLTPHIFPMLMELLNADDPLVRKNAITALRKTGDKRALEPIIEALKDKDVNVRMFAVTALMKFKDPRAIKPLINRMKEESEISWLISYAFMEMGAEAVDELIKAVGNDEFCYTRDLIILRMGDSAIETLQSWAVEGEGVSRMNAITLLGELKSLESLPTLDSLLGDEEVGWVVAHSLAKLGEPAWDTIYNRARQKGLVGENALKAISQMDDPRLHLKLLDCVVERKERIARAASEPLVRAGGTVVPLIIERMQGLSGKKFDRAAEIICRINDPKAYKSIAGVLFPDNSSTISLKPKQLDGLRQAYLKKGSIEPIRKRLQEESAERGSKGK